MLHIPTAVISITTLLKQKTSLFLHLSRTFCFVFMSEHSIVNWPNCKVPLSLHYSVHCIPLHLFGNGL